MTKALILDGNSEISAQERKTHCYLICLRLSIRARAVTNACATFSMLPSNTSTIRVMKWKHYVFKLWALGCGGLLSILAFVENSDPMRYIQSYAIVRKDISIISAHAWPIGASFHSAIIYYIFFRFQIWEKFLIAQSLWEDNSPSRCDLFSMLDLNIYSKYHLLKNIIFVICICPVFIYRWNYGTRLFQRGIY